MAPSPLKIKVNALNRLVKEEGLYKKEYEQQQDRINKMKADNADEYEIKKQIEVLEDTKKMISEIRKKIEATFEGLPSLISESENEDEIKEAQEKLKEVEEFLKTSA